MSVSDASRPATVTTGHLVLTEELREQIHERLLGMLDSTNRRLERHGDDAPDHAGLVDAAEAISAALVKLDAGYYGVCEMCEEPIPFERLDAVPSARLCMTCQARPRPLVR